MICEIDKSTELLVSEDGRIFREVSQWTDKYGYKYITLHHKNIPVHRLVAGCFVAGRNEEKNIVMHKDDNPANNTKSNLKWGTYSENNFDAIAHGLRKKHVTPIRCMETGEEFQSARHAALIMFGIPKRGEHILRVIRGQRGKAYGYHWEVISR